MIEFIIRFTHHPKPMIKAQIQKTPHGAILFDSAQVAEADERWFAQVASTEDEQRAGRGAVVFFEAPFGACVLRHYHRGGLAARLSQDRYLWTGRERTRAFREFRLLAELAEDGLPVPAPLMARYVRTRVRYQADLITRQIPAAQTLAERLVARALDAALATRVGRTLADFHAKGVWHADLNANNVMVDAGGKVWLIDFDRCARRKPAMTWQLANLQRLWRSFGKLQAHKLMSDFDAVFRHPLLAAYHRSLADRHAHGERA